MAKGGTDRYAPAEPPATQDAAEVLSWALRELQRVSIVLNNVAAGQVEICYAAPDKPRNGMIRYADGAAWNPGSGAGYYGFSNGAWRFLG